MSGMVAGWRWPWLIVMGGAGSLVLVMVVRLAGWTLSDLDQGASVGALIVGLVGVGLAWTQRQLTGQSAVLAARVLPTGRPLEGLPRLDRDDRRMAVDRLGVHPAISLPAGTGGRPGLDPDLPSWVERDLASDVRVFLTDAKVKGGFLVLAGNSSVGKSRLLYETALDVLEGWPVVICSAPGNGTSVNELAVRADELTEGVFVWLDELHRFLPGPAAGKAPVTAGTIAHLRDAPAPVIIVGALWPEHLRGLRATRERPDGTIEAVYPEAVDALRDVTILTLEGFNDVEVNVARGAGAHDPRLAVAVSDPRFGVTQTLAGARQLVERYETAVRVQKALLWAAIDAQRVGVRPPLTDKLLTAAARGYLTGAYPTDDWAQPALIELSRISGPDDRATAPLHAVYDPAHRIVVGYDVADYLLQHATRTRRTTPIPDASWRALTHHITNPDDLVRLGHSAWARGLEAHAVVAYREAADAGDSDAAVMLAVLLAVRGELNELRARSNAGDFMSTTMFEALGAKPGDIDELSARADAGDRRALSLLALRLVAWLGEPGKLDKLLVAADSGDARTASLVAEMPGIRGGKFDELRASVGTGNLRAAAALADRLAAQGALDELRARADTGDPWAAAALADRLAAHGALDELRARADAGDWLAATALVDLLAVRAALGDLDGLRQEVAAGTFGALDALRAAEAQGSTPAG
jgi:hypothetical protein